jgi:predicted thioredoxin/glutaredoxin
MTASYLNRSLRYVLHLVAVSAEVRSIARIVAHMCVKSVEHKDSTILQSVQLRVFLNMAAAMFQSMCWISMRKLQRLVVSVEIKVSVGTARMPVARRLMPMLKSLDEA